MTMLAFNCKNCITSPVATDRSCNCLWLIMKNVTVCKHTCVAD